MAENYAQHAEHYVRLLLSRNVSTPAPSFDSEGEDGKCVDDSNNTQFSEDSQRSIDEDIECNGMPDESMDAESMNDTAQDMGSGRSDIDVEKVSRSPVKRRPVSRQSKKDTNDKLESVDGIVDIESSTAEKIPDLPNTDRAHVDAEQTDSAPQHRKVRKRRVSAHDSETTHDDTQKDISETPEHSDLDDKAVDVSTGTIIRARKKRSSIRVKG